MKEFGSDFHYITPTGGDGKTIYDCFPFANLYADGRQALIHLFYSQGWKRLWIPEYFCYEVIESLKQAGLRLSFYADNPGYSDDSKTLDEIHNDGLFLSTDAILRVNFFGTRSVRNSMGYPVAAVVEDHTHDLIGYWATNSHADWCIASLRKSLPIPEGGILWSPLGHSLPKDPELSNENEQIASIRWNAMKLKTRYLDGENVEKASFRSGFVDTESYFDNASICSLDQRSKEYLHAFDVSKWYHGKRDNWRLLQSIHKEGVHVLHPEDNRCNPFSLVLLFDIPSERDRVRKELIDHKVYPSILWSVPCTSYSDIYMFSQRMLSIHCDSRYSREDIVQLRSIIESVL